MRKYTSEQTAQGNIGISFISQADANENAEWADAYGWYYRLVCNKITTWVGYVYYKSFRVPSIDNIHRKVLKVVRKNPELLRMSHWEFRTSCCTTHCRGGWVIALAGKAGQTLANKVGDELASMLIYQKSSTIPVDREQFYVSNKKAMEDIIRCAKLEARQK